MKFCLPFLKVNSYKKNGNKMHFSDFLPFEIDIILFPDFPVPIRIIHKHSSYC